MGYSHPAAGQSGSGHGYNVVYREMEAGAHVFIHKGEGAVRVWLKAPHIQAY